MKRDALLFPAYAFSFFLLASSVYANSETAATETPPGDDNTPPKESYETNIAVLIASFTTVFVGGLGDKTFLIAAFMSMKFKPILVFIGACGALFIILSASAAFGSIVPGLIPEDFVHVAIIVLFFFFGVKFLYEAYKYQDKQMAEEQSEINKKIDEVESKLNRSSILMDSHREEGRSPLIKIELHNLNLLEQVISEGVPVEPSPSSRHQQQHHEHHVHPGINRAILLEAFSMIFFAEWGDRSQIYTIALASQHNPFLVFIGAFLGHVVCIIIAIIGGRYIAERLSERTILAAAGILYILLGVFSILD